MAEKKEPSGGSLNPIKGSLNDTTTVGARGSAIASGAADRDAAIDKGVSARNGSFDKGIAARGAAMDNGLAARQQILTRPAAASAGPSSASKGGGAAAPSGKSQKAGSGGGVASPASTPGVGSGRIVSVPSPLLAPIAAALNKINARKIQGVNPVKVTDSAGNVIVQIEMAALVSAIVPLLLADGSLTDYINTVATDRANDAVAAIPSTLVGTCDPGGTIEVLLR